MRIDELIEKMLRLEANEAELIHLKNKLQKKNKLEGLNKYLSTHFGSYNINSMDDFIKKYLLLKRKYSSVRSYEDFLLETEVTGSVAGYSTGFIKKYPEENQLVN